MPHTPGAMNKLTCRAVLHATAEVDLRLPKTHAVKQNDCPSDLVLLTELFYSGLDLCYS